MPTKTKKRSFQSQLHKPVKHHHAAVAIAAALLVFGVAFYTATSYAADDRYKFVLRGVVVQVNDDKSLEVAVSHVTGKAEDDLKGKQQAFKTTSASKYYKQVSGKDKRVTFSNIAAGHEVTIKGVAKTNDAYYITWLRINDRSFTVVGRVKDVDRVAKTYTVEVISSTYKPTSYVTKNVIMNYGNNSEFSSGGVSREHDDVRPGDQKVKITGTITDQGKWEIAKLVDNYTGK